MTEVTLYFFFRTMNESSSIGTLELQVIEAALVTLRPVVIVGAVNGQHSLLGEAHINIVRESYATPDRITHPGGSDH